MPITPRLIFSLGATAPPSPSAREDTTRGNEADATVAATLLNICRRVKPTG